MKFADLPVYRRRRENVILRKRILDTCSRSETARRDAVERCRNDIVFWMNYFCWTYDPRLRSKCVPFIPYKYQEDAISRLVECVRDGRDAAILKSRDMGASWLNVLFPTWFLQFHPMNSFLLVSRNEDYVDAPNDPKSLFWKIDFLVKHQPKWILPRNIKRTSMHIGNEDNGSVIDGESTTGEVGRGDRRTGILLDEFASFGVKEGYNALASTQSATNCRIFNSTPKGQGNAFADVVNGGSAEIVRMHWSEHPEKAKGIYSSVRDGNGPMKVRLMDDFKGVVEVREKGSGRSRKVAYPDNYPFVLDGKIRSPWYDVQCARAITSVEIAQELDMDFTGSDYNFFDSIAIEKYRDTYCRPPHAIGNITFGDGVIRFMESDAGPLALWELPGRSGRWGADRRFVVGADVSAGTGASNSTLAVYDRQTNEKVAEYANPNVLPDDFGRVAVAVCKWFNDALLVPDRTGPTGEVFVARVKSDGPNIQIYRSIDNRRIIGSISDKEGVFLTPTVRTEVMHLYRDALGSAKVINKSGLAVSETLRFICKMDGTIEHSASANAKDPSGASANHGDRVIADALATKVLCENATIERPSEVETPHDTLAWRMEVARREENERLADELGAGWEV